MSLNKSGFPAEIWTGCSWMHYAWPSPLCDELYASNRQAVMLIRYAGVNSNLGKREAVVDISTRWMRINGIWLRISFAKWRRLNAILVHQWNINNNLGKLVKINQQSTNHFFKKIYKLDLLFNEIRGYVKV